MSQFVDKDPQAKLSIRLTARPGDVGLRDRIGWKSPQEHQRGDEQFVADLLAMLGQKAPVDEVQLLAEAYGKQALLLAEDEQDLEEAAVQDVVKAPVDDTQALAEDYAKALAKAVAETVGSVGQTKGTVIYLIRADTCWLGERVIKLPVHESQGSSDAARKSRLGFLDEFQGSTELFWKSDIEEMVSEGLSLGETYSAQKTKYMEFGDSLGPVAGLTLAQQGFGECGFGEGGFGGEIQLTG